MDDTITKFVRKHLQLLLLEREENLECFFKDFSPVNLYYMEKSGLALNKLNITNIADTGAERYQIDFERADGLPLEHGLSSGDLAICIRSKEKDQIIKAIVMNVGESTLSLSTNKKYDDVQEDEHFTVIKSDSDFTYKSQTRALKNLEKKEIYSSPCLEIINIMFDNDESAAHKLLVAQDPIPKIVLDDENKIKFYNENLAEDQKSAVEFAIKRRHFAIVQGPPGTGKTTTLIEAAMQFYRLGKKMLICAPTNVAVDNLVVRLGQTEAKPLRLGHPTRIAKSAIKYSLDSYLERDDSFQILKDIKKSIKNLETNVENSGTKYLYKEIRELKKEYRKRLSRLTCDILRKSPLVLCTLNSASASDGLLQSLSRDHFDVLIVDEASQAIEASLWIAIPNAPKLVLAGDINQLPPVVMCQKAVDGGLNVSLMERAIKKLKDNCFVKLTRQYRMNEKIMLWSSVKFYNSTLVADDSVKNHLLIDLPLDKRDTTLTGEAMVFIDTCGCECEEITSRANSTSKGNFREVIIVNKVVTALINAGMEHKDIGVITPYALQVDFIRKNFASESYNIEVSSVDGFQGREKEVIILSLVRSNQDKELGFVTDIRRLNVAVTRARRSLVVIGDSETMESDEVIKSLLKHIEENGLLQSAEEYLSQTIDKEIETESSSQNLFKSKSKVKTKNKALKKQKKEKDVMPEVQNSRTSKSSDEVVKNKVIRKTPKGTDLSACVNKKIINAFKKINLHTEEDKEEEDETETCTDNNDHAKPESSTLKVSESEKEQIKVKNDKNIKEKNRKKEGIVNHENEDEKDKSGEKNEDEEFNKIIKEFEKSNSTCSFKGCKKSTKLIKLICEFCKKWFCLEHGLQEIHGCGKAIRQKVQKEFKQKKPGTCTVTCTKKEKDKFAKKLKELEDARKSKKKVSK